MSDLASFVGDLQIVFCEGHFFQPAEKGSFVFARISHTHTLSAIWAHMGSFQLFPTLNPASNHFKGSET